MKLLLTSAGLSNRILQQSFLNLVDKEPKNILVAFVITASKVEVDASFVEKDINLLKETGVTDIERIDISEKSSMWHDVMKQADVVWFEGGNTFYLLDEVRKTGLDKTLKNIVKDKLYVGVSAGSILITPNIGIAGVEPGDPNDVGITDLSGLSWVNFEISPHTPEYVSHENVEDYSRTIQNDLYALDDQSAVTVIDGTVAVISEGEWKVYRK